MSSPPDPLPSDGALDVMDDALLFLLSRPERREVLTAAYRIDMPHRDAWLRTATIREVVECLQQTQAGAETQLTLADALGVIQRRFNQKAQ